MILRDKDRPMELISIRYLPRAFALARFHLLCPVCSKETRVPPRPKQVTRDGDGVFRCFSCKQRFVYNPFVDLPKEELREQKALEEAIQEELGDVFVG